MATTISQFLLGILLIILAAMAWAFALLALLWVLWLFIKVLVKWILRHKWAERQVSKAREKLQRWWVRNKLALIRLWEFVSEIFIDPLFFGYVVFALFNRLALLTDYTRTHPQYNFWQILNLDMENDMNFYAWFILIFFIWMIAKGWAYRQQARNQRDIVKELKNISKKLDDMPKQVRLEMERKDDGNTKPDITDSSL